MTHHRRGIGRGMGKGYKNLLAMDTYIHSLSARGIKTKCCFMIPSTKSSILNAKAIPDVQILSASKFDAKFSKKVAKNEILYATTEISPKGIHIFVRDSGDRERNAELIAHEVSELYLFNDLVKEGTNPNIADEIAHNINPIKLEGVQEIYPLNPET